MKTKVRRPLPKPVTADQRRGLEDVDELLKLLIRQNRKLHLRLDRLAHSMTTLGEPEIDRLLKALRKRVAKPVVTRKVTPRRRVQAA